LSLKSGWGTRSGLNQKLSLKSNGEVSSGVNQKLSLKFNGEVNSWLNRELYDALECMLYYSFYSDHPMKQGFVSISTGLEVVFKDPLIPWEIREICKVQLDLFLINLNKSEKDFSPSTMYDDYAINSTLFHWQSQSTTGVESPTGQRYIHHRMNNHKIIMFVREYKNTKGFSSPYVYLGKANYIRHEGSKPISFVWELERELPAGLVVKANKSVL